MEGETQMQIRTETAQDYSQVFELNVKAFGNREDESRLIERIRASEEFVPELSIVAEQDGAVVGHILLSRAKVLDGNHSQEVIVLAPIAVDPQMQRQGIGAALIREGTERSRQLGYEIILLIGHPGYYPQFGFTPARAYGLALTQFTVPDEVFQVYGLQEGALEKVKGELIYPAAFF
jgi:putative acetyltransferase